MAADGEDVEYPEWTEVYDPSVEATIITIITQGKLRGMRLKAM